MPHVEPDDLALAALGEPVLDHAARAHLAACAECSAEYGSLAATIAVSRAAGADAGADSLVPPAPAVWDRIRAELDLAPDARPAAADGAAQGGDVVPLRARGPRRVAPWLAAAAAAGVVVGAAGGAWWMGRDDDAAPQVVARATLDPLPGWDATGAAAVEQWSDGSRHLVLTLEGGAGGDGFHEVWLIDRDVTRLVSLGVLVGSEGSFTVPDGLDLDDFAVVDVSEEPIDGDPAHSGDSIIRGVLGA